MHGSSENQARGISNCTPRHRQSCLLAMLSGPRFVVLEWQEWKWDRVVQADPGAEAGHLEKEQV